MNRGVVVLVWVVSSALALGVAAQPASPPPGRAYLFTLDLAGTPLDEFPSAVKALNGTMTVVDKNGRHMLRASSPSEMLITLPQALPQDFTLEFDLIPKACCNPEDLMIEGTSAMNRGPASAQLSWTPRSLMAVGGGEMYQADMPADLAASTPGNLTHVVITFSGPTVKLYTNGRRMYTLEKQFARGRVLRVWLGGENAGNPMYLAGLWIGAGAVGPGTIAGGAGQASGSGGGSASPGVAGAGVAGGGGSAPALAGAGGAGTKLTPGGQGSTGASLNDAPAPSVHVSSLPGGFEVIWSALANVASYSVCRESPPSSPCVAVNLGASYSGGTAPHYTGSDLGLYPGTTHAYRVTAYRSDGHYGESSPVSGTTGEIPPPTDLQIIQDNSASGHLTIGWKPGSINDGVWKPITDHQVLGTGMTNAQMVAGTQLDVTLSPGISSHEWKVFSMVPDQKGGWFASPVPATLTYSSAGAGAAAGSNATKYRLVALGFKVIEQTNHDILAGDGAGDEVYLAAVVHATTRNLDVTNITTLTSATYGDLGPGGTGFSGRIAAGTASPSGGLKSGDGYPGKIDPAMAATGTPTRRTFPLLLWEGALDDAGMIVVHPTLWEEGSRKDIVTLWFNRNVSAAYTGYTTSGGSNRITSRATIEALRDQERLGPPLLGMYGAPTVWCNYSVFPEGDGHCATDDRPIGLVDGLYVPRWHDQMLVLSRAAIEKALSQPGPRAGVPSGVIIMTLVDPGIYAVGSYELYFKIERMP